MQIAASLAHKLSLVLGLLASAHDSGGKGSRPAKTKSARVSVKPMPCAQQSNGSDCGMFMLKFAYSLVTCGHVQGAARSLTRQQELSPASHAQRRKEAPLARLKTVP
jgi:hypothetical protein